MVLRTQAALRLNSITLFGIAWAIGATAGEAEGQTFYLPENLTYTIASSALDSLGFTLSRTLRADGKGHLVAVSSFVDPEGRAMGWHDFGNLEGPGWAANAVGGAWEIYHAGSVLGHRDWQSNALAILDHVLDDGFVDQATGFIRGYRDTASGRICLNYKHNSDWFCPGSMAKIAFQMLVFADDLPRKDPRRDRLRQIARNCAGWIEQYVEPVPNGWFARRTTPDGKVWRKSPDGGEDRFWQTSADGLFILQLEAALTAHKLADHRAALREQIAVFTRGGGIFGSINHDTYDPQESVAYAVAFRTLLLASRVLKDEQIRAFAYDQCLAGLEQFKMREDRHGVATQGLLYMERTWDTAYLWENAEAALAYFEAATDAQRRNPPSRHAWELDGLTILRAIARHHHGPYGFLTEGVDWNNHVGQQHHVDRAQYGDIRYTEPFLNNQHIMEPTLYYLEHLAKPSRERGSRQWRDCEGNLLLRLPGA